MRLMASTLRILAAARDGGVPGAESSLLKIQGSEIRQAISNVMRKALGPNALPLEVRTGVGLRGGAAVPRLQLSPGQPIL